MTVLKRTITLPFLVAYGLGTILGAGIYVLIGKVAVSAGMFTPFAFLLATIVASFTAFSYAELSARLPKSAGEAHYVDVAMKRRWLSMTVGWMIIATGVVSTATIANGFVGYLNLFVTTPSWVAITGLIIFLALLAIWGIKESVWVATIITLIEIGGLFLIIWSAGHHLGTLPERAIELIPPLDFKSFMGIGMGGFLAFYAYIGFEDMVNLAEEVKEPERNLPKGIIIALILSSLLYIVIALIAVLAVPIEQLQASEAPLAMILEKNGGHYVKTIGLISLFAVINGALVQIIMASRVIYGMAQKQLAPTALGTINPVTQTPIRATLLVVAVVLVLALYFPLITLAKITSSIILLVFAIVNASLVIIKRRDPTPPNVPSYPLWVPIIGCLLCLGLLIGF